MSVKIAVAINNYQPVFANQYANAQNVTDETGRKPLAESASSTLYKSGLKWLYSYSEFTIRIS